MSTPPALPPPHKPSNFQAIFITIAATVLLGIGSCWGFLKGMNFNGPSNPLMIVFAVLFVSCAVAFIVAVIWLIVETIKLLLSRS